MIGSGILLCVVAFIIFLLNECNEFENDDDRIFSVIIFFAGVCCIILGLIV